MRRLPYDSADALARVVGDEAARDGVVLAALRRADAQLRAFARERPGFHTEGLAVWAYPGPPEAHDVGGYVESDELTFWVELNRGDEGTASAFLVEAEVYEGQERVAELPVGAHDDPRLAAAALAEAVAELRRRAQAG